MCVLHSIVKHFVCVAQCRESIFVSCTVKSGTVCVLHSVEMHCVCIAHSKEALCVCTAQ